MLAFAPMNYAFHLLIHNLLRLHNQAVV